MPFFIFQTATRSSFELRFSTAQTAPGHLLAALSGLLIDQLEQPDGLARVGAHGEWRQQEPAGPIGAGFVTEMNSILLTAGPTGTATPFVPSTVFRVKDAAQFAAAYGVPPGTFVDACCTKIATRGDEWRAAVRPVLIELSPVCDIAHQGKRVNAVLVAGLVIPVALKKLAESKDAFGLLAGDFRMRWPVQAFPKQDLVLSFCHPYRITMSAGAHPRWIEPWFRIRDLPTASIRNLNAAYSARVGYVSLA